MAYSMKELQAKYFQNNKEKIYKRQEEKRKANKQKAVEFMGGKCADCGYVSEHNEVFDFHHKDAAEKEYFPARIMSYPWTTIQYELEKCIMLCANCHRIRHAKERQNG